MKRIATKGFKDGVWFETWKDPIYSTTFWIVISKTHHIKPCTDFIHSIRPEFEYDKEDMVAYCHQMKDSVYGHEIFLAFKNITTTRVVVHEVIHAKNFVFSHHGIKPDLDNDEHEAYYTDALVDKVVNTYEEKVQVELKLKKKKQANGRKRKTKSKSKT